MPKKDPRIDAYIAKSADFAKPILIHLRKLIHAACPEVEETLKWSMPSFLYQGILCGFAAFKQHVTFGFWKGDLMFAGDKTAQQRANEAMGHFGRLTRREDLPGDKVLLSYIKEAIRLNDEGIKRAAKPRPTVKPKLVVPPSLLAALKKSAKAKATFDAFSYSHKKEYAEWISEAKQEETRARRLATAIEWLSKGKSRNWKYERC
jgi:uncharacterized protein YdeI (YjbR/CyaY-like superfamily)